MGGIIRSIFNPGAEKRKKEKRKLQAVNAEREAKLTKQKEEEAISSAAAGKRKQRRAGRRRTVFSSALGVTDTGAGTGTL